MNKNKYWAVNNIIISCPISLTLLLTLNKMYNEYPKRLFPSLIFLVSYFNMTHYVRIAMFWKFVLNSILHVILLFVMFDCKIFIWMIFVLFFVEFYSTRFYLIQKCAILVINWHKRTFINIYWSCVINPVKYII